MHSATRHTNRPAVEKESTVHDKPVALVTGATKGIGLEIAKDLAAHGLTVLVGARNLRDGQSAAKTIEGDARAIQLDVTDEASIEVSMAPGQVGRCPRCGTG
jgi:NAD(P)-dependent dehydrogenase (short-subunit alcohol dehydrogenase family)